MFLLYSILYGCGQTACGATAQNACVGQGAYGATASAGCGCCQSRACSGFGRHGGESVCNDAAYYCRQYALCRCCCCRCRCCACAEDR